MNSFGDRSHSLECVSYAKLVRDLAKYQWSYCSHHAKSGML